jgi:hypothetical protein
MAGVAMHEFIEVRQLGNVNEALQFLHVGGDIIPCGVGAETLNALRIIATALCASCFEKLAMVVTRPQLNFGGGDALHPGCRFQGVSFD